MAFKFNCNHCGQKLQAEDNWVDKKIDCPNCNKQILIRNPDYKDFTKPSENSKIKTPSNEVFVKKIEDQTKSTQEDFVDKGKNFKIKEGLTVVLIDSLLSRVKESGLANSFDKFEKGISSCGLYGLYVAAVLGLITSIVFSIRYSVPKDYTIGIGVIWFFTCLIIHYIACKFLPTIHIIIKSTPSKLSSRAFVDAFALLLGLIGPSALALGVWGWIKTAEIGPFIMGLTISGLSFYLLCLCIFPQILNIEITERTTAGEEFIGLVTFFLKSSLKLIPVSFGFGVLLGTLSILGLLFAKFEYMYEILQETYTTSSIVVISGLQPLIGYLQFIIFYFILDLSKSILIIPEKLDGISDKI